MSNVQASTSYAGSDPSSGSDMLRASIEELGPMVSGSQGQPVINPAVAALAVTRRTIEILSKRLEIFAADPEPESFSTLNARAAAQARWGMERRKNA